MPKSSEQQRFIYKIHSSRLKKSKWNLTLPVDEARRNGEIISLASSQMLRWIDELNGISNADAEIVHIRSEIKSLRKEPNSVQNKRRIKQLYEKLDVLQYKQDYMCLIIDKEKDYYKACKGFKINGIKYKRLLGTNGGIKNSTIVFVSERLYDELHRRIENGRDVNKPLVTAKLEAYKSLTCSASIPVSFPNGILVVNDCFTKFKSDIMYLTDENDGEPVVEFRKDEEIKLNANDGFGLMLPALAERWSEELGLDYVASGMNTRFSFEKGMAFTFDFRKFADEIAGGNYIVKDVWGNDVDIRTVELILTESMVKLWDSFESCDDYISKSLANKYTFGIAKVCPKELENERNLNYQFIQSYDLNNEDIEELISPTVNEIKDILDGDWRKTVLYLKGEGLNSRNIDRIENDYVKALMIDHRMINDIYVKNSVYQMIRHRIDEAKVGVIKVRGNYSIVSGDPFSLCQSIFGLEVTGLLRSGEIYNEYWADKKVETLACFRAPMTTHGNIRMVKPADTDRMREWYKYMRTCTIFNSWDTASAALNGMDYDGDLVMLTDNKVLVNRLIPQPALICEQRKADKKISEEEDFIKSNIESFGNEIGQTTNWITSMFETRAGFEKGSAEYETLSYRIDCGELYQQNAIDKAKGIVCKPMPREWHDRHAVNQIADPEKRKFYQDIVADKKPYFMRYIYPELMKQYNTYIKNTDTNALREFQMTVEDIKRLDESKITDEQKEFVSRFDRFIPVGMKDCVMNKICRRFESEFDGYISNRKNSANFDSSILKSNSEYSIRQYNAIKKIYEDFNKRVRNYMMFTKYECINDNEYSADISIIEDEFNRECDLICPNREVLCNIVVDLCYKKSATRKFAWSMCKDEIIHNLISKNGGIIEYPVADETGEIEFKGRRFSIETKQVGEII